MNFNTLMTNDLIAIEKQLGKNNIFTWDGSTYNYIPGGSDIASALLQEGGYSADLDKIIIVRSSQFGDRVFPQPKDIISINNTDYEVDRTDIDDLSDAFYIFYIKLPAP